MTLSGNNGEIFRGFFVQARLVADDTSQTGAFVVVDSDNSKLSACTPSNEVCIVSIYVLFVHAVFSYVCSCSIYICYLFMFCVFVQYLRFMFAVSIYGHD